MFTESLKIKVCSFHCACKNLASQLPPAHVVGKDFPAEFDDHKEKNLKLEPPWFVPISRDLNKSLVYYSRVPHDKFEPGLKQQLSWNVQEPLACVQTPGPQFFLGKGASVHWLEPVVTKRE